MRIEGVSTSVAAFVGLTETYVPGEGDRSDPAGTRPQLVTGWAHYQRVYGGCTGGAMLPYAVKGFFDNGGTRCVVVRVPTPAAPWDLAGSEADGTGYLGLAGAEDVTIVAVPDLVTLARRRDGTVDEQTYLSVQGALVDWCTLGGTRMAILDTPAGLTPTAAADWRTRLGSDSGFAALYYPGVVVDSPPRPDERAGGPPVTVTPVGHVAGVWARTDAAHGVWKAPASQTVMGVRRLERDLTGDEHAQLNPAGVSCLRSFPANGTDGTDGTEGTAVVKVWGGRTLAVSDPSWRYVNVRRLSTFVTESVRRGTRWAASEPFDDTLVQRLQENVSRFLQGLAEEGALATRGGRPGFFVRCDASVNPASPREPGTLVIMVGIAPLTPGEFVVSRIVHADPGGVA